MFALTRTFLRRAEVKCPKLSNHRPVAVFSTHVDRHTGLPTMINIQAKTATRRVAVAESRVVCPASVASLFLPSSLKHSQAKTRRSGSSRRSIRVAAQEFVSAKKGPVLATAIIGGSIGAKLTSQLIPFCHPVPLEQCKFSIYVQLPSARLKTKKFELVIRCLAATTNKTGVEMEAMTGASLCALTIYDMLKGVDGAQKSGLLYVGETRLMFKAGGKSGDIAHRRLSKEDRSAYGNSE